jgi:hypothetical protein
MGPIAGLDAVTKKKILSPCREFNPSRSAHCQELHQLSYSGSLSPGSKDCKTPILVVKWMFVLRSRMISDKERVQISHGDKHLHMPKHFPESES